MAVLENDENNPDYTRSINRTTKSWSAADGGWWMPEHLLFDILILLPVATLLRLKSVCKSWCAFISSSYFIAQHLDRNFGKENIICLHHLVFKSHERTRYKFCLLSGNKYEDYHSFDCENFGYKHGIGWERFSSDGIVCIMPGGVDEEVDLWNPAMKEVRRLPESEQLRPSCPNDPYYYSVSYGSGYSVRSNDYKVVRTFVHRRNTGKNVVEVYSLKADSWRTILEDGVLSFKSIIRPVSRNGTCFWVGSNGTQVLEYNGGLSFVGWNDDSVVSFDFNDETFGTMPLPENTSKYSVLDFLGDKLAFISGSYILGGRYYEIWVLHKYGVKESWSKIWKIGPTDIPRSRDVYFAFGFSTNGDYILLSTNGRGPGEGEVYMYNLSTQENEYIKLRPHDEDVYLFVRCMESLVSVKRMKAAY